MRLPEETRGLLLIELGAEVPAWLDSPSIVHLAQQASESMASLGSRACACLEGAPDITHVIVSLAACSLSLCESSLPELGQRLVVTLAKRPKAQLLLCVPAETAERQRKSLLALAGELAKFEAAKGSVIVGAHFSAKPPPMNTLPLWSTSRHKDYGNG